MFLGSGDFSLDTHAHSNSVPILTYIWGMASRFQTLVSMLRGFINKELGKPQGNKGLFESYFAFSFLLGETILE